MSNNSQSPLTENETSNESELLTQAQNLAEKHQWADVINSYKEALKINPDNARAYQGLGDAMMAQEKWEEAIAAYQEAIAREPDLFTAYHKQGDASIKLERWEEAEATFKKALELRPNFYWFHYQLGEALAGQKKWEEAKEAYERCVEIKADFLYGHQKLGKALLELQQWEEAKECFGKAIALEPDYHWAHYSLGEALVGQKDWEGTVTLFKRAIEIKPDLMFAHHKLGDAYLKLERWEEAADSFRQALKYKGDFVWSYYGLGEALAGKQQWEEAINAYRQAIELHPDESAFHYKLGIALVELRKWDKAAIAYKSALQLKPDLSDAVARLDNVYQNLKSELESASNDFSNAIEKEITNVDLCWKLVEKIPTEAEVLLGLANVLAAKAELCYRNALELNSNLPKNYQNQPISYQNALQNCLQERQKNYSNIEVSADSPDFYVKLGNVHAWYGRLEKAVVFYRMALLLQPDYETAELQLQRIFKRKERLELQYKDFSTESIFYGLWLKENLPKLSDLLQIPEKIESFEYKPTISIIVPVYNAPETFILEMIESVLDQFYPYWELCIADDASSQVHVKKILKEYEERDERIKVVFREKNGHISATSNSALELATGDFITLLDHDDLLAPDALYEVVLLLNEHPEADMIYSDEDKLNEKGKFLEPFFKPDWCPDSFLSRMYTCHLGTYRHSIIKEIEGFRVGYEGSQDYDLVLRFTEKTNRIFHIPKVLYHWRIHSQSTASGSEAKSYALEAAVKAIEESLDRREEKGKVIPHQTAGTYIIRYEITDPKPVSIIIPTRNYGDVLDQCLQSIFNKSTYPNYEVIVIDNGSDEPETLELFEKWKNKQPDRFYCYPLNIPFNYSKLNNYGVSKAKGDYLLFLNNDTETITPDWIEAMVEQVQRPTVGAVGALLLYPDDTIQHAGIILGLGGVAGHSHKHFAKGDLGYFRQLVSVNNYSGVTAACLMCRREVYEEVNGFDETLQVAFNDVDFCLKIQDRGYNNICLPHVVLYHYESKSRGLEDTPEKQERFKKESDTLKLRWGDVIDSDPCYSPNLTRDSENYDLKAVTKTEILKVVPVSHDDEVLWGFHIDMPQEGEQNLGPIIIAGWVVGRKSPAVAVEIICDGEVVALAELNTPRPDVAQVFPHVPEAQKSGFLTQMNVLGLPRETELMLRVVFKNRGSALLGKIKLRY